jgi:hypothetical protein
MIGQSLPGWGGGPIGSPKYHGWGRPRSGAEIEGVSRGAIWNLGSSIFTEGPRAESFEVPPRRNQPEPQNFVLGNLFEIVVAQIVSQSRSERVFRVRVKIRRAQNSSSGCDRAAQSGKLS